MVGHAPREKAGGQAVRWQIGNSSGTMGVPSKKKRKGSSTWNQRKQSQVRLRTRPGTPSGVEEETWQGSG